MIISSKYIIQFQVSGKTKILNQNLHLRCKSDNNLHFQPFFMRIDLWVLLDELSSKVNVK
jgi:hypothetical protein